MMMEEVTGSKVTWEKETGREEVTKVLKDEAVRPDWAGEREKTILAWLVVKTLSA